ncbi:protein phosphatase PPM2 [Plasmodium sp. gorilla clade G2]|uniref:protein phosphatase PPM2 n=1 Tax=Plasmodium sp. gorilla clade G2 TaxID=880535 RepID=UPI000D205FD8|nr:protein phosphatase PPM2 [Plasmodium sp. gorilla clade G2]SOV15980.1 protein phosphatase PPM2 [Plasmodium sp. gorilla clade G2]
MGAYLSSPKTNKESLDGGNLEFDPSRYGLSCMQGWRKNMEDAHICYNNLKLNEIEEDVSIYGVFDGHGGPNVSKWISYNFRRIFIRCLKEANEEMIKKNMKRSENYKLKLIKLTLEKTFLKLDEEMLLSENQEKLKKYSVPTQENEEESDTRENYIYSILNDIISKNISIKAIEKDGKRCLQVVYNKDGSPVEEGNTDGSVTSSLNQEQQENNQLYEDGSDDNNNNNNNNNNTSPNLYATNGENVLTSDENYDSSNLNLDDNNNGSNMLKKDDASSDILTATTSTNDMKDEDKKNNYLHENNEHMKKENNNCEENGEQNKQVNGMSSYNKALIEGTMDETMDEKGLLNINDIKTNNILIDNNNNNNDNSNNNNDPSVFSSTYAHHCNNKEGGVNDYLNNEENNETNNIKRLKKDMCNDEKVNTQNDIKEEDKMINMETYMNEASDGVKSELTYDNLKCMEEQEKNGEIEQGINNVIDHFQGNNLLNNDNTSGNINSYTNDDIPNNVSLQGYDNDGIIQNRNNGDEGNNVDMERLAYDEASANVIDNNINNDLNEEEEDDENNNNDEETGEDDCNGVYSSEELRLFENYYSNDYEDNIAYSCGSTALVAVILKGYLIVANAGDSRAIVCFNGNSLGMSTDHKPHLQTEEARIKKAGGYIANGRVDGNLNLTRAIGDLHYKRDPFLPQKDQKISAFPEITCVTLTPEDEFLFLACDGIWDCKDGQDVVGFVKTRLEKFEEIADDPNNSLDNTENSEHMKTNNNSDQNNKLTNIDQNNINNEQENILNTSNNDFLKNENLLNENNMDNINMHEKSDKEQDLDLERDQDKYDAPPVIERKKYEKFNKLSQICEELCDECLSNNYKENDGIGCDNMTCLIVQYNPEYKTHTEKKFLNIDDIE